MITLIKLNQKELETILFWAKFQLWTKDGDLELEKRLQKEYDSLIKEVKKNDRKLKRTRTRKSR